MLTTMPRRSKAQRHDPRYWPHPLTQWRIQHLMTQAELAVACGMKQAQLSKIETYQHLPLRDVLERLLRFTKLPTDALVRPRQFMDECPQYFDRVVSSS